MKVYVIVGENNSYDYERWNVRAFTRRASAEKFKNRCQLGRDRVQKIYDSEYEKHLQGLCNRPVISNPLDDRHDVSYYNHVEYSITEPELEDA